MRRPYGLRPRLLAALVLTAAVTLLAAAFTLLGPLQERLRDQTAESLEAAVLAARPTIARNFQPPNYYEAVQELAERTNSRVVLYGTAPYADEEPRFDTDTSPMSVPPRVFTTLIDERTRRSETADAVQVISPLHEREAGPLLGVMVVNKPLTDVAETVDQVQAAFITAALVGLVVALVLGGGLSTALLRRLERLRVSAILTASGVGAPPPADDARDEIGDLARALATMHASLRRQEEARRAFVATASHELRTPLTLLQGMLELLDEDLREGRVDLEDAHEQVAGAQRQLRRLEHLASDLLDLSRLDSEAPLRFEPLELGELTRAVAAEFELRAAERGLSIDVVPPIAPCWAKGDPGAVARIVRILLDNALRFAPRDAPVRVSAAYHGERATVEVADAGPGVPPDERELIFERFQRGSDSGGEEGFGLGLAIGRELARRQGGDLALAGDEGEPGARFVLSLPIELPAGSRGDPREPVASG